MTRTQYPNLLSKFSVGPLDLTSRIVMAPMSRGRAGPTATANQIMADYYAARASAGLIITEGTHTSVMGRGLFHTPEVFTKAHAKGWRLVTDAVHANGGLIFCQLWHAGRTGHSSFRDGEPGYEGDMKKSVAPSAIKKPSESGKQLYTPAGVEVDLETPREMTIEEIKALPEEFRNAAQTAMDSGFDGVEVHGASGFLLDTFMQSSSNHRTDEYGGSFENRFRIVDEVLRAVFEVYEPGRVGVRISPNSKYNGMGSDDFRESFLYFAKRLSEYGLGYLHVVIGLEMGFHEKGEPMTLKEIRKVYPGTMIGNMSFDAEKAEHEIGEGNVDAVAFGRPFLANPDFVERVADGRELNPVLDFKYWYTAVNKVWTTEGYTDLSVAENE